MRPLNIYRQKITDGLRSFFLGEVSPFPLAILRISIAATLLLQCLVLVDDIQEYYGKHGMIQGTIKEYISSGSVFFPRMALLAEFFGPLGISYDQCVAGTFNILITSLLFLLFGCWTRFFAFTSWLTHYILMNSATSINYGVDQIHHIMLTYFIFFPVAETLSMDKFFSKASFPTLPPSITSFLRTAGLRLIQFHVCLIYFQSGTAKIEGYMWWNGEAIWRSIMSPGYQQYDFSWMADFPWTALLAGYGTLVLEVFYPILIWPRKTRFIWAILTIFLHLGIAFFQGLWIFSATMIALNLSVFLCERGPVFYYALQQRRGNVGLFSKLITFFR